MYLKEFLDYISKPACYRTRTYTEEDIRKMLADRKTFKDAAVLCSLFCHEKALHDPSKHVKALQDRMHELEAKEEFINEMSALLQSYKFDYPRDMQCAIGSAVRHMDFIKQKQIPDDNEPTLESCWYVESY